MSCNHTCGCSPEIRDARTDEWVQIAPESARPATLTPEQPVKAPGEDKPTQEPVLPRRIKPEDVRVGMIVERRNGDYYVGGRVATINDFHIVTDTDTPLWYASWSANSDWSLWLIEDEPAPVDPDAADRQCAWADYRKDYGVGDVEMNAAHKAFMAGWKAAREGDQSGPLR